MNGTGTLSERRGRGFRFAHATVAKDARVDSRNGIHGGLSGLRVGEFRFAHATVAKDAKVDTRSGLREGFITPWSQRTRRLIQGMEDVAALAAFA